MKTIFALAVVLAVSALSAAGAVPDFEPLQDVVDQIKTASNGELTVSTGNLISFVQDTDTDVTTSINEIKELIGTVPQLPDLVSTLNKAAVALGGLLQKLITSFLNVLTQILNDINRNALKTLTNVSELVVKTEQDLQECATKQIQVIQGLLDELKGLLKNINAGVQTGTISATIIQDIVALNAKIALATPTLLPTFTNCSATVVKNALSALLSIVSGTVKSILPL